MRADGRCQLTLRASERSSVGKALSWLLDQDRKDLALEAVTVFWLPFALVQESTEEVTNRLSAKRSIALLEHQITVLRDLYSIPAPFPVAVPFVEQCPSPPDSHAQTGAAACLSQSVPPAQINAQLGSTSGQDVHYCLNSSPNRLLGQTLSWLLRQPNHEHLAANAVLSFWSSLALENTSSSLSQRAAQESVELLERQASQIRQRFNLPPATAQSAEPVAQEPVA